MTRKVLIISSIIAAGVLVTGSALLAAFAAKPFRETGTLPMAQTRQTQSGSRTQASPATQTTAAKKGGSQATPNATPDSETGTCPAGQEVKYAFTGAGYKAVGCYTPASDEGVACSQASACQSGNCMISTNKVLEMRNAGTCTKDPNGGSDDYICNGLTGACGDGSEEGGGFIREPNHVRLLFLE